MPRRTTSLLFAALALAASPAFAQPAACTDFYGHANAAWLAANPLPADRKALSRWDQLAQLGRQQHEQVLAATTAPAEATVSLQLAHLLASAQDEAAIEAAGTRALAPVFEIIDGIRRKKDIPEAIVALHAAGLPVAVDLQVLRDRQGRPYAQVGPGGMGLPDPAFYTGAEPELAIVRNAYKAALVDWLAAAGASREDAAVQAEAAWQLELALARGTGALAPAQVTALDAAQAGAGDLDLAALLQAHGLQASQIALANPGFLTALDAQFDAVKPAQWKHYLRAQVLRLMAPALPKAFHDPYANLYDVILGGMPQPLPRAVRARQMLEARVPEFLDAAYTERFLPVPRQQRAQAIAGEVRAAAGRAIDEAAWLSAEGRAAARQRLDAMQVQVGLEVPSNVFDGLQFRPDDLAGNVLALRRWLMPYALVRARSAWPAEQWQPLVAWLPAENRLVMTAATLQPPVLGDEGGAADYGSFGALVAQQMMLAFQAWDGADAASWNQRAQPLVAQYNAYSATGGATRVNGTRSFLQNQADLAGLEIAWRALAAGGEPTQDQARAFFTGWAGLWARQDEAQALADAQATADHAPAKWRVNGPLANLPAFGQAHACKAGPMQRAAKDQVSLWR